MPMEILDVAIISTLPVDGPTCTDVEFERWAQLIHRTGAVPLGIEVLPPRYDFHLAGLPGIGTHASIRGVHQLV